MKELLFISLIIQILLCSCKKEEKTSVVTTEVKGIVRHKFTKEPLSNIEIFAYRYFPTTTWAMYDEKEILAETLTDSNGAYNLIFTHEIKEKGYRVGYDQRGFGHKYYEISPGTVNTKDFDFHKSSKFIAHVKIENLKYPPLSIEFPNYVYNLKFYSADTTVNWTLDPDSTYNFNYYYADSFGQSHSSFQRFTTKPFKEVYEHTFIIDASTF